MLLARTAVEVCEAVGEGRSVSLVEGEGRGSSIVVASLGKVTGSGTGVVGGGDGHPPTTGRPSSVGLGPRYKNEN